MSEDDLAEHAAQAAVECAREFVEERGREVTAIFVIVRTEDGDDAVVGLHDIGLDPTPLSALIETATILASFYGKTLDIKESE